MKDSNKISFIHYGTDDFWFLFPGTRFEKWLWKVNKELFYLKRKWFA